MSSEEDSSLDIEIEALKAIYIHELEVGFDESKRSTCVKVSLHPATADNAEEQYVCLDLVLDIPTEYPDVLPEITIRNPRGLSDEKTAKIEQDLQDMARENLGSQMLYQLIEVAKEHLTQENVPCCQCTICLYGFADGDVFTKTPCYHYFHSHCLARYIRHALEQMAQEEADKLSPTPPAAAASSDEDGSSNKVVCPVCRLPLSSLLGLAEQEHPSPVEQCRQPAFCMTPELERLQHNMAQLYVRQQRQGGIINVDAEKNKFLLEISAAPESNAVPEIPKRAAPFKLSWGPPARLLGGGGGGTALGQGSEAPFNSAIDRQRELNFARPPKIRNVRPRNRQPRYDDSSEAAMSNGCAEQSGGSPSSSGADRLQRSDRPRRPRPHRGRGRGGGGSQQQNWHRSPPERRGPEFNGPRSEDYRDCDSAGKLKFYDDGEGSREMSSTSAQAVMDSGTSWNEHRDQDCLEDGHRDVSPSSPGGGRYYDAPDTHGGRHRGGSRGYRRSRRGTGGDRSQTSAQVFRRKQLRPQGAAPRNHEPPGLCTAPENR